MNVYQLSKRLERVADYLPSDSCFADIGSDHAYLPCYVCLNDSEAKAIAGEVNVGPYESALSEVRNQNLEDRIEVRLGDGLEVLEPGEVRQVVIAGMGGSLIKNILDRGKEKLKNVDRIIVQPNIGAKFLREWFIEQKYQLTKEEILEENGHTYEILIAQPGDPLVCYQKDIFSKQLLFGPHLLKERPEVFRQKWKEEYAKRQRVLTQINKSKEPHLEKMNEVRTEMEWIEEVLAI
ncbi:tRNA (adenine(22)-N(1))-methyltransferase TrmK [Halobacillus salinarum]|uniref:tRNA (Adenine(22)-N(1))-methyltransferase TrmK n=1 Tax=Halobacillus salinarum TaxID=2932257 RepID=A0ABY4EF24_9BACI|nr:tRNA (adenine(22)-N(1))-methyltransferase TrmK [Halobacillus salinarum]UOQ42498.1 tRNA (adenine(22)-N(1))-methyltransferase TrmK [Halobacillus salinarum]